MHSLPTPGTFPLIAHRGLSLPPGTLFIPLLLMPMSLVPGQPSARSHLSLLCQVRYISDFFKARPPQHCLKEEELERKPSLSLTLTLGEADHNHCGYPHSS